MSGPVRPPLTVETLDGTTVGRPITTIKVTNGDLTVSGTTATIDTSGGGGGGSMTSFDVAGNAGATQTIGNADTFTIVGGDPTNDIKVTMSATDTATIDLQTTSVTPGSYSLASITVDSRGRLTAASSGSVSVPTGANPTATVGPTATNGTATTFMRSDAAPALADTLVTPATYTYSTITVDQQGRITSASSGTAPTVDGSGASTQVAVWSDADTLTGYGTFTFDGANLTVEGYIKSGNVRIGDGTGEIETDDANDLVFKTNSGTNSGTLALKNGTDGNLIFDPSGTGLLQIEGTTNPGSVKLMCEAGTHGVTIQSPAHSAAATYTFKMPTSMGTDGQVLTTDGTTQTSWTSVSGGTSPGGSDTEVQFNDGGSFGGDSGMTFNKIGNNLSVTGSVSANNTIIGYNAGEIGTKNSTDVQILPNYGVTGGKIVVPHANNSDITITPGGTGKVQFNGAYTFPNADGSANQVLQTDGSGALSFATAGGSSSTWEVGYYSGDYYKPTLNGSNSVATTTLQADIIYTTPIYINKDVDIDRIICNVTVTGTASNIRVGIYNKNSSTGHLGTLITSGTASAGSTGFKEITVSQTLTAGVYYAAFQADGTVGVSYNNAAASNADWAVAASITSADAFSKGRYNFNSSYSGGMVNLTSTTPTSVDYYIPVFMIRID